MISPRSRMHKDVVAVGQPGHRLYSDFKAVGDQPVTVPGFIGILFYHF